MNTRNDSASGTGHVAVVTGGARGIGRAIVEALLDAGHHVVAMDLRTDALGALRAAVSSDRLHVFTGDVTSAASCGECIEAARATFGPVDILVNNAGIGVSSLRPDAEVNHPSIEELDPEIWQQFFLVNVMGSVHLARACIADMKAGGFGRIVNNTTSFLTMLRVQPYGATKSALESLSAVWAKELVEFGITVNVVVPGGPTDTDFVSDEMNIPREKMLRPAVMGPPVAWLCSDEAAATTGQRFIGGNWNASLPGAEAAAACGRAIGWPELSTDVIWPD